MDQPNDSRVIEFFKQTESLAFAILWDQAGPSPNEYDGWSDTLAQTL